MQLLDLSDHLPGLKRLPGRKTWFARDKVQFFSTWEEADQVLPQIMLWPDCAAHSFDLLHCVYTSFHCPFTCPQEIVCLPQCHYFSSLSRYCHVLCLQIASWFLCLPACCIDVKECSCLDVAKAVACLHGLSTAFWQRQTAVHGLMGVQLPASLHCSFGYGHIVPTYIILGQDSMLRVAPHSNPSCSPRPRS